MNSLPDPRAAAPAAVSPLAALACRPEAAADLARAVGTALRAGEAATVEQALRECPGPEAFERLAHAVESCLREAAGNAAWMRYFAVPLVLVAGGRQCVLSGVLPDAGQLRNLFVEHAAIGSGENFGLSNALIGASQLRGVIRHVLRARPGPSADDAPGAPDLVPDDIAVDLEEGVTLRFLVGAALSSPDAPDFTETAGNIGAWGMTVTRMLARQLGAEGVSLLPLPRAPTALHRALAAGRFAERETAFQLSLTGALREWRTRAGEPEATLAAFSDASIGVTLASVFEPGRRRLVRWPLEPVDDFASVVASIRGLLDDCRVSGCAVEGRILDAASAAPR